MKIDPEAWYSVPQVCKIVGMGEFWVREKIKAGAVRAVRPGSRNFKIKGEDLQQWVAGLHSPSANIGSSAQSEKDGQLDGTTKPVGRKAAQSAWRRQSRKKTLA